MPIPPYTIDGVLPPYTGSRGPGDSARYMSPYQVTASQVVNYLATSAERKIILCDWLKYRAELRGIGVLEGFQWLDGSFVEDKEQTKGVPPNDLDLVAFYRRPDEHKTDDAFEEVFHNNIALFDRRIIKVKYRLDAFPLDLDGDAETLVDFSRYFLQLFSHQRDTNIWKGMLQVRQDDAIDDAVLLARLEAELAGGRL